MKRKLHYNEGLNIKLARQLISKDLHDDDEDEEMSETTDGDSMNMEESNQGQMPLCYVVLTLKVFCLTI